jgi:hypothetical protein
MTGEKLLIKRGQEKSVPQSFSGLVELFIDIHFTFCTVNLNDEKQFSLVVIFIDVLPNLAKMYNFPLFPRRMIIEAG